MEYIIVMDSCGERTDEMRQDEHIFSAPLTMQVEGETFVDDDSFDRADFLEKVKASEECPKSACPSPDFYKKAYEKAEKRAYAVTLSAELSGSCNSAVIARELLMEQGSDLKIHVFNSCSASVGETLITQKILECERSGMPFDEVVGTVEEYIRSQSTYFVLEDLETLRKNGRLTNIKAFLASALKIKPVMASTPEGSIVQLDQARGINKALVKMVDALVAHVKDPEKKIVAVSHCNCPERAKMVLEAIQKRISVKGTICLQTGGISTMYANDGGVIVVI